jgi:hypothetical protein
VNHRPVGLPVEVRRPHRLDLLGLLRVQLVPAIAEPVVSLRHGTSRSTTVFPVDARDEPT